MNNFEFIKLKQEPLEKDKNNDNFEKISGEFEILDKWTRDKIKSIEAQAHSFLNRIEAKTSLGIDKFQEIKSKTKILEKITRIKYKAELMLSAKKIKMFLRALIFGGLTLSGITYLYNSDSENITLEKNVPGKSINLRDDFDGSMPISKIGIKAAEWEALGATADLNYSDEYPYGDLFDLYRYYFGQELQSDVLSISEYNPTDSKNSDARYVSINHEGFKNEIVREYNSLKEKPKIGKMVAVSGYKRNHVAKNITTAAIGNYRIGRGIDEKGEYICYYDVFNNQSNEIIKKIFSDSDVLDDVIGAKKFEIYGRIYLNDIKNNL